MRIDGNVASQLNTTNLSTPSQAGQVQPLGQQIQQVLFGRPRPMVLDPSQFPDLATLLRSLNAKKRKFASLAGDEDEDYALVLADDAIASIDEHGTIFLGAAFLRGVRDEEVQAGVIAHEVGHRPKRWREARYRLPRQLSRDELDALCRYEETLADMFAGRALAELGMSPEPLVQFLEIVQVQPHREYHPAAVRADIIREAHDRARYRKDAREKIFPEFNRFTGAGGYIGEF